MIRLRDVHKWYGDLHVLKGIDLRVEKQERVVICGPSGSGKSTLIRCINRLEDYQRGSITIDCVELSDDPRRLAKIRAEVGMVFQSFNLFPHLSILENLTLGPIWVRRVPRRQAEGQAMAYLEKVRIAEHARKFPGQLSGGQQQRAAIARSLCMEPKIMLFDEPTSAIDPEMSQEVLDAMIELAADGMTMIVVTHEMAFARRVAHRLVFMDEGRIVEGNSPEELFQNPRHERTRRFLRQIIH